MLYRMMDSNGDYLFGKNMQYFYTRADAVAQAIKTRLKLLANEWWEDKNDGLPLFQNILGKNERELNAVDLIIKERISGTKDVLAISQYQSALANRTLSIYCIVDTNYGQIELREVIA